MKEKYSLDTEIDQIYDRYNNWIEEGRFDLIENSFRHCVVTETENNILLAMMTAVLPVKSEIKSYVDFFHLVKTKLEVKGKFKDTILIGLEP